MQGKTQMLQDALYKYTDKIEVGTILEAKEDCMNNFTKGQRVTITKHIEEFDNYVLDDLNESGTNESVLRFHFKVVGHT